MSRRARVLVVCGLVAGLLSLWAVSAQGSTDSFSVSLPLNTATDSLGSGAANLETTSAEDDYSFTLGSAQKLEIDFGGCPLGVISWSLLDSSSTSVGGGGCGNHTTSSIAAGTYTIAVTPQYGQTGTYDLRVFVVPPPDAFSVSLPVDTDTDTLGSGQADLETSASEDDYTFTLSAARKVEIDLGGCPGGVISWNLLDSGSSSVASGGCGNHTTSSALAAGTYTLHVTPQYGQIGTYSLRLFEIPPPDAFSVTLPVDTTTDTLGSGQANLETTASEDDYTFTLSGSHRVELDFGGCPLGVISWNLVDSGSSSVASGGCGNHATTSLGAGTYTLRVTPQYGQTGTYSLHLFEVPPPDAFSVTLPVDTTTDTLGSGQANLETTASEDDYTFTIAAARTVEIDLGGCPLGVISWTLFDSSNSSVISGGCGVHVTPSLAPDTYTLVVTPQYGQTGTYSLLMPNPPANDDFANAQTITGSSGSASGSTNGSTGESGEPQGLQRSIWYVWTAPATVAETFTGTIAGGSPGVAIYAGTSLGSLRLVSAQSGSPGSQATAAVRRGLTYYVQLNASGSTGTSGLAWGATYPWTPGQGALIAQGFDGRGPGADPTRTRVSVGPVSVDVTSGNVLLGIPGPSFPSPAGALGVSVAYNSLPAQPSPSLPPSYDTGGGICPGPNCHAPRDYSTGARTAPGFGPGFTLGLSAGSAPVQLIDHSALAPDPPLATGEDDATADPDLAASMDFVEVISSDGSSRMFQHTEGTNEWLPADESFVASKAGANQRPPGDDQTDGARLVKDPSPTTGAPTWTLVDPDGTTATFGPVGTDGKSRVWSVQEQAKGNTAGSSLARLEYSYTAGTGGTLFPTTITEQPSGRSLSLDWNDLDPTGCPAAILCVTGPDAQTWTYVGDASGGTSGQLVTVNDGTRDILGLGWSSGQLTSVKSADDLDPTNASPGYDSTHEITVGYRSSRATSVSDHDLTSAGSTISNTYTLAYTDLDGTTGMDGCGAFDATSAAHAASARGGTLAASTIRTGCRRWTHVVRNSGAAWDYITDMTGQLMETRLPNGSHELSEHATDGRLLWSEDANGQPTDYTYDGKTGNLQTVQAPDPDGSGPLSRPTTSYRYNEQKIGTSTTAGTEQIGLKAEWYANQTLSGIPKTTTYAHTSGGLLDENWTTTGPAALGGSTTSWSARFSGTIDAPTTGDYTFQLSVDDGATVSIDDQLVVGDWTTGTLRTVTGDPIVLDAGTHRIVVQYFQASGPAELHVSWEKPGDTSYSLIPYNQANPNYGLQTSSVSPEGEVSFSHYADPTSGQPDYTESGGSLRLVNSFTYDSLGRVLTRVQPKGNAGATIDSAGDLSGTPNATYVTTYSYYADSATAAPPSGCPSGSAVNQAGQLETISRPGYADQTSVYDAAGRVLASTKGKGTTCSTYDPEGRLLSQRVPGDSIISSCASDSSATACYTYDPAGLVRSSRTATGEVDLAYDEDGHVTTSTQKDASGTTFGESSIEYDAGGNPTNTIVAAGPLASATNYHWQSSYNTENQLTGQKIIDGSGGQQEQGTYAYDNAGTLLSVQSLDLGLGVFTYYTHDHDGNITGAYTHHGLTCGDPCSTTNDSHPYADFTYTRDHDGRITSQTLSGDSLTTATTNYTYDAASRLGSVTEPSGLLRTYHYDDDSNRTSIDETPSGGSLATIATYTYSTTAQDRLSSITNSSTTNYTYDTDGETATYSTNTLTWNGHDQIATDDPTTSSHVGYTYDPLGRLRERTTTGPTADNEYIYPGTSDQPIMVTDGAGTITESYLYSPVGIRRLNYGPPLVSGVPNGTWDLNFTDAIGNTAGTINGSGTTVYTYDAFGTPDQTTPTNTLTNRFLGKNDRPLDTLSGLVLMGARPYDSTTGRFLSSDPIEGGSANLYDYANQDPINGEDPDGTKDISNGYNPLLITPIGGANYTGGWFTPTVSGSNTLSTPVAVPSITSLYDPVSTHTLTTLSSAKGAARKAGCAVLVALSCLHPNGSSAVDGFAQPFNQAAKTAAKSRDQRRQLKPSNPKRGTNTSA